MAAPCSGCERLAGEVQRLRELLRELKRELDAMTKAYTEMVKLMGYRQAGL